jgi:quinohemoprotein ethanol dehydrogenase
VRYGVDPRLVMPGPGGAHNWFPMAYSPRTRLAYFPPTSRASSTRARPLDAAADALEQRLGRLHRRGAQKRPPLQAQAERDREGVPDRVGSRDQRLAWQVELPRHGNGGVFVTASDLVFEGTTKQTFAAFDARTGGVLWEYPTQSAPVAGGITYMLDGVQYVAINAGWGGGAAQIEQGAGIELPRAKARCWCSASAAPQQLPQLAAATAVPPPPPLRASEAQVAQGAQLFAETCAVCHGQRCDRRSQGPAPHDRRDPRQVQPDRARGALPREGHGELLGPAQQGPGRCDPRLPDRAGERGLGAER